MPAQLDDALPAIPLVVKLQVSFAKETYKTDDILQKRPNHIDNAIGINVLSDAHIDRNRERDGDRDRDRDRGRDRDKDTKTVR